MKSLKPLADHFLTEEDMCADDVDVRVALCYPDRDEDENDGCYFLTAPQQADHELVFN